ncbi:MAG: fibronectin type III domain-containing protein, partial [Saprospiraceae bacterium]
FCLLLSLSLSFGFSNAREQGVSNCEPVSGLVQTAHTSSSITYSWNGTADAEGYRVWYTRQGDLYTSPRYYTTNTSYTFSNLTPGVYTFYFETDCGGASQAIIIEDTGAV